MANDSHKIELIALSYFPEQIEFWQDQGNRLIEFADCYFEIARESVALEEQRQSSIKKLIPFVNVKNAGLN